VLAAKIKGDGLTPVRRSGWCHSRYLLDPNALLFNATKNLPAATKSEGPISTPRQAAIYRSMSGKICSASITTSMTSGKLFGHFIHDANDSVQATPEWQGDNIPTVGSNFSNPSYSRSSS